MSHVPAKHPLTLTMNEWAIEEGLEWQDPHFVFTAERDDISAEASWEWWRGERYLSGALFGDAAEPDEIGLFDNSVHGDYRPFTREGFLELWRRFVA
jgi:hypothetical protein